MTAVIQFGRGKNVNVQRPTWGRTRLVSPACLCPAMLVYVRPCPSKNGKAPGEFGTHEELRGTMRTNKSENRLLPFRQFPSCPVSTGERFRPTPSYSDLLRPKKCENPVSSRFVMSSYDQL